MKEMLVIDTNIIGLAADMKEEQYPVAIEFLFHVLNRCNRIVLDNNDQILDEYKKFLSGNPPLICWMHRMKMKNKIEYRKADGDGIKGLDGVDNIIAIISTKTDDKIIVTENPRHFTKDVIRRLNRKGVKVLPLELAYTTFC